MLRYSTTGPSTEKAVGRWCLAGSVERPGVVGWQIEVVAVMPRYKPIATRRWKRGLCVRASHWFIVRKINVVCGDICLAQYCANER